jgi:hypothetical protein
MASHTCHDIKWRTKIFASVDHKLCRVCGKCVEKPTRLKINSKTIKAKLPWKSFRFCTKTCQTELMKKMNSHLESIDACIDFIKIRIASAHEIYIKYVEWMGQYSNFDNPFMIKFIENERNENFQLEDPSKMEICDDINYSGCSMVMGILPILASNNDNISGEIFMINFIISCCMHSRVADNKMVIINPDNIDTANWVTHHPLEIVNDPCVDNFVYLISLTPFDYSPSPNILTPGYSKWEHQTGIPPVSNHYFIVVHINGKAVVMQAYYGHYTYSQWLKFNTPLEQMKIDGSPAIPDWFRKINNDPKYRRVLQTPELKSLLKDINSLMVDGDHISKYADITGILHDKNSISRRYNILAARMNIDYL